MTDAFSISLMISYLLADLIYAETSDDYEDFHVAKGSLLCPIWYHHPSRDYFILYPK